MKLPFVPATPTRRQLLRRMGIGTALAPFLPVVPILGLPTARAAGFPKRLVLVYTPNGSIDAQFWPQGTERDFSFIPGGILEPLTPHRKDIVVVRNLRREFDGTGGDHERGIGCMWTGAKLNRGDQVNGGGWPSGPSIDQIIGKALPLETDFRTLEVAVQPGDGANTAQRMCYAGSDQPVAPEINPYAFFDRIFSAAAGGETAANQRLRARRQSVLDVVKEELNALLPKIAWEDRLKIQAQLDGIRAVERQLTPSLSSTGASGCAIRPTGQLDIDANDNFPAVLKLQTDLLVSALACDRTRIASLQWSRAFSLLRHTWVGVAGPHHTVSHDTSPAAIADLTTINRWYASQFAYLLAEMKKVPEGAGTLLDNSLVVWCTEFNESSEHRPGPPPVVMAGRAGGSFTSGRYLNLDPALKWDWNQVLVSICQLMGTKVTSVGDLGPGGVVPALMI